MLDATAQDRDADTNSLDSRDSFVGESRFGVSVEILGGGGIALAVPTKSISHQHPYRRELLRVAFSKLSYRVARV